MASSVDERLHGERVLDVADGAHPAHARVRDGLAGLGARGWGSSSGRSSDALVELAACWGGSRRALNVELIDGTRGGGATRRGCRRRRGRRRGACVLSRVHSSRGGCRPRAVHCTRTGRAGGLRQQRGLDDEVGLRLAAEPAAEQRDVDGDVVLGDAPGPRPPRPARRLRVLGRAPRPRSVAVDARDRGGGLHRRRARGAARRTRPRRPSRRGRAPRRRRRARARLAGRAHGGEQLAAVRSAES